MSLASTVSLEPEPIPLDIKVVLSAPAPPLSCIICWPSNSDADFTELFKVAADFNDFGPTGPPKTLRFTPGTIASTLRREKLRPLDRSGVARAIPPASRMSGDFLEKLSTQMRSLIDSLEEADYLAGAAGKADPVGADELQAAIDAQRRRRRPPLSAASRRDRPQHAAHRNLRASGWDR